MADNFQEKMYEFMAESRSHHAVTEEKLSTIEKHAEATNGAIAGAQRDIAHLEIQMIKEDRKLFYRIIKYVGFMLIVGTFFWVKETRDVFVELLKIFI